MTARPLDLLYVGTLPPHHGGSAIAMSQVLSGLAARGHRVRAVAPITAAELEAGDRFAAEHPELEVHRYVMPFLDTSPDLFNADEYYVQERTGIERVAGALIDDRTPDLAIAGRESFAWYVPELSRPAGIPVVAYAHGSTTHAMADGSHPRELTRELVERFAAAALVVTPAEHMAASLRRLGVPEVAVVPNPVDLERFRPAPRDPELAAELGVGESDVVVDFSNLIAAKRPLDIVAAAERALERDPRLLFLVVGDGPLLGELRAASADCAGRFRFVDWVDYSEMPRYLSVADVVVQPSAAEGQALIYLEAQAAGRTVVASDIQAAREVIDDGETGLLYPVGDTARLADALVRAADAELRARIGEQAAARVRRHALPDAVDAHERLLTSVAEPVRA